MKGITALGNGFFHGAMIEYYSSESMTILKLKDYLTQGIINMNYISRYVPNKDMSSWVEMLNSVITEIECAEVACVTFNKEELLMHCMMIFITFQFFSSRITSKDFGSDPNVKYSSIINAHKTTMIVLQEWIHAKNVVYHKQQMSILDSRAGLSILEKTFVKIKFMLICANYHFQYSQQELYVSCVAIMNTAKTLFMDNTLYDWMLKNQNWY